jgi:hypothetical protein
VSLQELSSNFFSTQNISTAINQISSSSSAESSSANFVSRQDSHGSVLRINLRDPFEHFLSLDEQNDLWANTLIAADIDASLSTLALAARFWMRLGSIDYVEAQSPAFQQTFIDELAVMLQIPMNSIFLASVRPREAFYSGTDPSLIVSTSNAVFGVEIRFEPFVIQPEHLADSAAGFSIRLRHALHVLFEKARADELLAVSKLSSLEGGDSDSESIQIPPLFDWLELVEDPDCRPLVQVCI